MNRFSRKNQSLSIAAALLLMVLFPLKTNAQTIFFPDPNLKMALITNGCDQDHDGEISIFETFGIFELNLSYSNIFSLAGLEQFPMLQRINCSNNLITTIAMLPPNLFDLDCSNNYLQTLNLKQLPTLANLNCSGNPLQALLAPSGLSNLNCSTTNLTSLYIKETTSLQVLDISNNQALTSVCSWTANLKGSIYVNDNGSPNIAYETNCCSLEATYLISQESCYKSKDGQISIQPLDDTQTYTYSLNNGMFQANNVFGKLGQGIYWLTVKSASCTKTTKLVLPEPPGAKLNLGNDTSICVYENLKLNTGSFSSCIWSTGETSSSITVTQTGIYAVTVRNAYGCTQKDTIHVQFTDCSKLTPASTGCSSFNWAKSLGSTGNEQEIGIAGDNSNSLYIAGKTPGSNSIVYSGNKQATCDGGYLAKLDSAGNTQWIKSITLVNNNDFGTINTDTDGMVYVALAANSLSATICGTTVTTNTDDIGSLILAKITPDGQVLWIKQNNKSATEIFKILFDSQKNMYIMGYHYFTGFTFDNKISFSFADGGGIFFMKLDPSGTPVWGGTITGIKSYANPDMAIDSSGNVYISGMATQGIIEFKTNHTNVVSTSGIGAYEVFIAKFDNNSSFQWAKSFGGGSDYSSTGLATDANSHVYLAGNFPTNGFKIGPFALSSKDTASYYADLYLAKFNNTGDVLWAKSMGGEDHEGFGNLFTNHKGEIYLSGTTSSRYFSFDTYSLPVTSHSFLLKATDSGELEWLNTSNAGRMNIPAKRGKIYGVNTFQNSFTISGTTLTSKGNSDIYMVSLNDLPQATGQKNIFQVCGTDSIILDAGINAAYNWSVPNEGRFLVAHPDTVILSVIGTNGCLSASDSIVIQSLPKPTFAMPSNLRVCDVDSVVLEVDGAFQSYLWTDNALTSQYTVKKSGTFGVKVQGDNNCWSGYRYTDVALGTSKTITKSASICSGDSILIQGKYQTKAGTYTSSYQTILGCDSIVTTVLTVNPVYQRTDIVSICEGESYNGHTASATYTENLRSVQGCDSIVTTILSAKPKPQSPQLSYSGNQLLSSILKGNQWYLEGEGPILNAVDQLFYPLKTGNYFVIAELNGCFSDTSNMIYYLPSGTTIANQNHTLIVAPIPVADYLSILCSHSMERMNLYNAAGLLVYQAILNSECHAICNLSKFTPGYYILYLYVKGQKEPIVRKVVKQ